MSSFTVQVMALFSALLFFSPISAKDSAETYIPKEWEITEDGTYILFDDEDDEELPIDNLYIDQDGYLVCDEEFFDEPTILSLIANPSILI
jgi:hypothetical protein